MAEHEAFRVEREGHVAEVILTGPGKGNAMGPAFFRELPGIFAGLDKDETVRAVVLRGDNGNFSYGLDLRTMAAELMPLIQKDNLAAERLKLLDLIGELQRGFDLVARCRKPVIAAVAGASIGGGVDLVSACDVRLAARNAKFSVREVKLAIVADMGSLQRLPRIIGQGHARELAFTGKDIDADRALRIGLVSDVYEDEAAVLAAARTMANEIAEASPIAVQGIKQVMSYGDERAVLDAERYVAVWNAAFLASNDLVEAIQSFMEKRPAKFTGK
jgi:enoyl-CoA hydratase